MPITNNVDIIPFNIFKKKTTYFDLTQKQSTLKAEIVCMVDLMNPYSMYM